MENSIILPIDGVKSVSQYLNSEQLGELILALIASTSGEDPGEMEPAVGLAYCFLKDRARIRSEICDPIAECSDITKVQQSNHPESGSDPSSDHSENRSDGSAGVLDNPDGNSTPDTPKEHKSPHKRREEGSSLSISKKNTVSANELFEKLWKLYPNKKGKGKISDARKRTLLTIGEDQMTRAIQRYIKEHDTKLQNGEFVPCWQNGSTFFNSGYVDYLDENYSDAPQKAPPSPVFRSAFPNYEQQSNTDWNEVFFQAMLLQEESTIQPSSEDFSLMQSSASSVLTKDKKEGV